MSLLFVDSFDHYSTAEILNKWTTAPNCSISNTTVRTGVGCLAGNASNCTYTTGLKATLITGGAFYITGNNQILIEFLDVGTDQCNLFQNADSTLSIRRNIGGGAVVLGTSTNSLSAGIYQYIEFKATINNSGSYEVRVNGDVWVSGTGDTQNTVNAYATVVKFAQSGGTTGRLDDVYICDNLGTMNNNFLGDVKIECILPDAVGSNTQWVPYPSGNNYSLVDEVPPNSDTDYVVTSGIGYMDTYGYSSLVTTSGSIFGVQVCPFARKDDAGSRSITSIFYIGATPYSGSSIASVSDNYNYWPMIQEKNPQTNSSWNISEINTAEFGIKLVT